MSAQSVVKPTHGLNARNVRREIRNGALLAFEAFYEPHSVLPEHAHRFPFFTYVLQGDYEERSGRTTRACVRGGVILHGAGECHTNVVGRAGTASLNVEITPSLWSELSERAGGIADLAGRVLTGDIEWQAFAVWREFHSDDSVRALALEERIASLCDALVDARARGVLHSHPRLDRCAEYLDAQLFSTPRLLDVARLADVHPMHLVKLFRRRFGCSMGEYLRRRRVAWACAQLADDSATISSIAAQAGFADHAHFTRTFRRITRVTPKWYRDRLRGRRPRRPKGF